MTLRKIEGFVTDLVAQDGYMDDVYKIRQHGVFSAAVSSALNQATPVAATLASYEGLQGKEIQFSMDDKIFKATFSDLHFNTGDYIVVIYDDDILDDTNTFAVLNPSNGVLSMGYMLGQGTSSFADTTFKSMVAVASISFIFMLIMSYFLIDHWDKDALDFIGIMLAVCFLFWAVMFGWSLAADRKYPELSDEIFTLIGFKDPKKINFLDYQINTTEDITVTTYDYRYREAVDFDPYPTSALASSIQSKEENKN